MTHIHVREAIYWLLIPVLFAAACVNMYVLTAYFIALPFLPLPQYAIALQLVMGMGVAGAIGALAHQIILIEGKPEPVKVEDLGRLLMRCAGSLLVGAVAANVLHFPLASVFDYRDLLPTNQNTSATAANAPATGDSSRIGDTGRAVLSILALSLLAGYTGPVLLEALARRFQDTVAIKMEEKLKGKEDILNRVLFRLLEEIVEQRIIPNATDLELLRATYEDVLDLERQEDDLRGVSAFNALVAGYYSLEKDRFKRAIKYLVYADGKRADLKSDGQKWATKNLLALAYHYDFSQSDWFDKTIKIHNEALQLDPKPNRIQTVITNANLGFAYKDHLDAKKQHADLDKAQEYLSGALTEAGEFPHEYAAIRDTCRLGLAAVVTLKIQNKVEVNLKPIDLLHQLEDLELVAYVIQDGSIERQVIQDWEQITGLNPFVKRLLCSC